MVKGTESDNNIAAFGGDFQQTLVLQTDNGPPFNGKDSHELQRYLKWTGIKHKPTKSAEDPEANGLVESLMKHCQKIWHTSITERLNPKAELNRHLRMYRTTPRPSTGKLPSEILFGRKPRTRLPHITENKDLI